MTSYSEEDLILPSLKIIQDHGQYGLSTSNLVSLLRAELKPTGEDLEILQNRPDDKFSQKVRNLRSHNTLSKKGLVEIYNNKFRITNIGSAYIRDKLFNLNQSEENKYNPIDINKYYFLFLDINSIQFNVRIKNICKKQNIIRFYQIIQNYYSWTQLPNFGKKSLDEIDLMVVNFGGDLNEIINLVKKYDFKEIFRQNELEIISKIRKSLINTNHIDTFINDKIKKSNYIKKDSSEKLEIIINHRFGLNNKKLLSLESISNFFGLTRERIRQIEAKFVNDLIDENLIKILLLDLDELLKKIKLRSQKDILNIIVGKFFLKKIELQGLAKLLKVFLKKSPTVYKPWYDKEKEYFFYDDIISKRINDSFVYLKKIGAKKNKSKHEDFKSLSKFQDKFKKYYPSDLNFYDFINSFENVILDRENNTIAYFREKNFIYKKLKKLKCIVNNQFKSEDLFKQLNRDYRYEIPSIKVMHEHLKLMGVYFDDEYVNFESIHSNEDHISVIEEKIINLIKDNNNLLFIEKIQEIKFDYDLTTSSIYVYLNNNVLFKEVTKGIYTTADKYFNKYEMNLAVQERSKYRKKFKTEVKSTWDKDKYVLFIKLNYFNTISSVIYLDKSINEIIGENKYIFIQDNNIEISIFKNVLWSKREFFHDYKIKSGDTIKISFDINSNIFNLEKFE